MTPEEKELVVSLKLQKPDNSYARLCVYYEKECGKKITTQEFKKVWLEHLNGIELNPENLINNEKDKIRNKEKDLLFRKMLNDKAGNEMIIDILKEIVPKMDYDYEDLYFPSADSSKHKESLVLHLTDVHIGKYPIDVLEKKVEVLYEAIVEITRMRRLASNIDELYIAITGDIVDGQQIYPQQAYEQSFFLMDQIFSYGIPTFCKLFNNLSKHFKKIHIYTCPGNHGNVTKFSSKDLNFDTIFAETLKLSLVKNKKIDWNISWDWKNVMTIYDRGFLMVHGNQIKSWMNLPFYGIKERGQRWSGSLEESWEYMLLGHVHSSIAFTWNNFRCIVSGTWLDHDGFAEEVLGLKSSVSQTLIALSPKRGIVATHEINLSIK